jgi:nicotinamide-nucleotide amidase
MKAVLMSVGDELALGQTIDTNTAWLAQRLAEVGVVTSLHLTVADDRKALEQEIRRASELADVVLISGGLGPTEDDLTRHALADAMGAELELRDEYVEQIRRFFAKRHLKMPDTNIVQATFPIGSTPISNTCGTAPGIRAEIGDALVFAMPGVPREMKVMFERDVLPHLTSQSGSGVILATTLWCYGAGESHIGEKIRDLMQRGQNPAVGTTAQQMIIGVRIHAHGKTRDEAGRLLDDTARDVRSRLGELVFGADDDTLWSAVARLLVEKKRTVATAESCTGGLIAKSFTDIAGSSDYFLDGVVTYSNEAKTRLLDVPADLIEQKGAVSAEVAEAMAVNCRERSGSDYAISVTGIAGPTGGTPDKPVGLVYIGLADANGCEVTEHLIGDFLTREEIRDRTRKACFNRLRLSLLRVRNH